MTPFTIIIPTLNEEKYLPILLQSIYEQEYEGDYEVIVVDGASEDATGAVVREFQEMLPYLKLFTYKRGTSRQRNFGAQKAKYEVLVFLDADTKLPKYCFKKLQERIQGKRNFTAMPLLSPYDGRWIDILFVIVSYIFFYSVSRTNPITSGMCTITTKAVHKKIGGFNESVSHAEDIDYGLRARRSGAKHYIFLGVRVFASARRLDQIGRWKLARLWYTWYKDTVKHGPESSKTDSYTFGIFR